MQHRSDRGDNIYILNMPDPLVNLGYMRELSDITDEGRPIGARRVVSQPLAEHCVNGQLV